MKARRVVLALSLIGLLASSVPAFGQTTEELIAVRNAFAQAIEDHDIDAILSLFTDDGVQDSTVFAAPLTTHGQMRAMWEDQFSSSPDWHTEEGRVLAVDSMVVVDHAAAGTNTRDTEGLPWIWPHLDVFEFDGTKIKRLMSYGDYASIMVQLGWAPAPEMPSLVPSVEVPDPEPTGLSPLEANAELVRRWNSHDAALAAKMDRADATLFVGPMGMSLNRVQLAAVNELYFRGFSDTKIDPVRTVDLGDGWILFEHVVCATHDGTFMGVLASGYPVEIRAVWLTHYDADGLVTEMSIYYDNLTLINQMTTEPEYSPAGTWIVTVPTPMGNITLIHTVSPQTRPGGSFAGVMEQVNADPTNFGMFPDVENGTDWVTQTVWHGRDKVRGTHLAYGTKKGDGPIAQTVTISLAAVEWTLTGPNTNEGTATLGIYLAEQDADGDGLPDEDQGPVSCMGYSFTSRRLTMMPGCVPTSGQ